jgi:hypothetical protein
VALAAVAATIVAAIVSGVGPVRREFCGGRRLGLMQGKAFPA